MKRTPGAAVALFSVILLAKGSHAEGRSSCAPNREVDGRVAELVGPGASRPGRADIRVEETYDGRYRVLVSVNTARGNAVRQFEAASCELATNIAALIVAISLYPDRTAELEERASAGEVRPPTRETRPPANPLPLVARDQDASRARSRSLLLSAELFSDLTSMPSPALGGGGTVGFRPYDQLLFEASLGAFAPQTVELPNGRSARFEMLSAAVRGCFVPWPRGVLAACIGAVGVRLAGSGSGVELPRDSTALYVGPSAGVLSRFPAGRGLALRASIQAFAPLAAHRFLLDGAEVHHPSAVGIAWQVGPEISF